MLFFTVYTAPAKADSPPTVTINGAALNFDVQPVIVGGRLLVPLRTIFDALGASVTWDAATQTVSAVQGNTTVILTINSQIAYKNGGPVTLDVPPALVSGRTMVPLRFVAESMSCYVNFDPVSNRVVIQSGQTIPNPKPAEIQTPAINITGRWQSGAGGIYYLEQSGTHISGHGGRGDVQWVIDGTIIGDNVTLNYTYRDAAGIHNDFKENNNWQYRFAEEIQDSGGLHTIVAVQLQKDGNRMEGYQYLPWVNWAYGSVTHVYQGGSDAAMEKTSPRKAILTRMSS